MIPQLPLNFKNVTAGKSDINASSETTQPAPTDGKVPQRLLAPKRDEPSLRIAALNKYLPLKL